MLQMSANSMPVNMQQGKYLNYSQNSFLKSLKSLVQRITTITYSLLTQTGLHVYLKFLLDICRVTEYAVCCAVGRFSFVSKEQSLAKQKLKNEILKEILSLSDLL